MPNKYFKYNYPKNTSLILEVSPENDIKMPLEVFCRTVQA